MAHDVRWLALVLALAAASGCAKPARTTNEPTAIANAAATPTTNDESTHEPAHAEPSTPPVHEVAPVEPAIATPPPPLGPAAPAAVSPEQRAALFGTAQDPEPEVRGGIVKALEDVSYIVGNEWSLDAFKPVIADLGGGYVGVGPDQAYLFIGWQRPEFAWLIDYDSKVNRVHAMYRAVFELAETRREFLAAFEHENAKRISDALADHEDTRLRRLYRNNRDMFRWRLRTVERALTKRKVASWLTDDATYDYVRQMVLGDRVRSMRVNLNEAPGMTGIAEAARTLGVTIRVVYLSNAEEYWDAYAPQFSANLQALPRDEQSLVLRTRLVWQVNRDYVYNAQSLGEFITWLAVPGVSKLEDIVGEKPPAVKGAINFVMTKREPPQAQALPAGS